MNRILKIATLLALCAALCLAQTTLSSTTLTPNITANTVTFAVGSASGISALGSLGQYQTMLYIDHELMGVRSVSGTNITVDRGKGATAFQGEASQTTHHAAAVVWIGPPQAFAQAAPVVGTQCVRANLQYVPIIIVPTGQKMDCLGLTTAGQYVRTDAAGPGVLGATVASAAGVVTPSSNLLVISGTAAITGFTVPAGAGVGYTLTVIPSGAFTWTTATNIAVAGTAVVNRTLTFTWTGSAWQPSYV